MSATATTTASLAGIATGHSGGSLVLTTGGGVAIAGGGDVSVSAFPAGEAAYAVGEALRRLADPTPDEGYVATMAGTGAVVGTMLTGDPQWGGGVGFVCGWIYAAHRLRSRR